MKSLQNRFKSFIQKVVEVPKHFLFSTKTKSLLILDRFYFNNNNVCGHHLFLLDLKTKQLKELHIPKVTNSDMGYKIIASCNGLLCISHYSLDQYSTIFLWNPTTKQTKRIFQQPPLILPPNCLIGFYESNDFYVVRFYSCEVTKSDSVGKKTYAIRGEKYSLSKGLWREIKGCDQNLILKGHLFWTENTVMVKETLFWIAMEVNENVSHEMIISFDSCNDVISKIEMPINSSKDCVEVYKKLVVYNHKDDSSLGLIICLESKNMEKWLYLWVLCNEYEGVECWNKVQTIGMFSRLERPVGVWKNEVLMATKRRIHSVGGTVALLPEDDIGAEFSYNLLSYEERFFPLHDPEEIDYFESGGFLMI
jgi:F-box interacting protein